MGLILSETCVHFRGAAHMGGDAKSETIPPPPTPPHPTFLIFFANPHRSNGKKDVGYEL